MYLNKKEYGFSVDVDSKKHIKTIIITDERDGVFIEGTLGHGIQFNVSDSVLTIHGKNGVVRFDITEQELNQMREICALAQVCEK